MGVRAWWHRGKAEDTKSSRAAARRQSALERRNAAKGVLPPPRRSREEPYDSEFITRYGDPFD